MLPQAVCDVDPESCRGVCGEIKEEAFKQRKEMQMRRAMKGLGTDLGKTEPFSAVGA